MPAVYTCDICGRDDAGEDWDGSILCTYHSTLKELQSEERAYKKKWQWVRSVWFADLQKRREKIKELKRIIEEIEPK